MVASSYDAALRRLLVHEGGYSNHPSDPGGPTNFGITLVDYRRYVNPSASAADVRAMRLDEAKAIYRARYWNAMRCDDLPAGLDYAAFDYGVNSGVARASRVLQRLVGFADDGRVNDALLAEIRKRDAGTLIRQLCDERLSFLKRLRTWPVFGAGWGRRVAEVRAAALAMAARSSPAEVENASPGKGVVPAENATRHATTGAVIAAGGAAAQQAHQAGVRPIVIAAIVVATVALVACVRLGWRWHRQRRQLNTN